MGKYLKMPGDPMVVNEAVVLADTVETKSGERKRLRIPLAILQMAA
jgi:hypothetical protein